LPAVGRMAETDCVRRACRVTGGNGMAGSAGEARRVRAEEKRFMAATARALQDGDVDAVLRLQQDSVGLVREQAAASGADFSESLAYMLHGTAVTLMAMGRADEAITALDESEQLWLRAPESGKPDLIAVRIADVRAWRGGRVRSAAPARLRWWMSSQPSPVARWRERNVCALTHGCRCSPQAGSRCSPSPGCWP
jgi:hypothetical protein